MRAKPGERGYSAPHFLETNYLKPAQHADARQARVPP
jgi:hypothetical protein